MRSSTAQRSCYNLGNLWATGIIVCIKCYSSCITKHPCHSLDGLPHQKDRWKQLITRPVKYTTALQPWFSYTCVLQILPHYFWRRLFLTLFPCLWSQICSFNQRMREQLLSVFHHKFYDYLVLWIVLKLIIEQCSEKKYC